MDAKSIGNTIAALRKKNGMTQVEIYRDLGGIERVVCGVKK